MSSLPLISHHLFVAAAGHQDSNNPAETSSSEPAGSSSVLTVQVLDGTEPLANLAAIPLLAAPGSGGA